MYDDRMEEGKNIFFEDAEKQEFQPNPKPKRLKGFRKHTSEKIAKNGGVKVLTPSKAPTAFKDQRREGLQGYLMSTQLKKGLHLFQLLNGEVSKVQVDTYTKILDHGVEQKQQVTHQKGARYIQALNKKNAIKKFIKQGHSVNGHYKSI